LRQRLINEAAELTIMIWPFAATLRYAGLAEAVKNGASFVSLTEMVNERELIAEAERAIEEARRERATILVFPELGFPLAAAGAVKAKLAAGAGDVHPILTVMGLCHHRPANAALDLNEAVILGPGGAEVHRHRKLASFTAGVHGTPIGEQIMTG